MVWLTWRQHRLEAAIAAGALAAVAAVLVLTGVHEYEVFRTSGLADCVTRRDRACSEAVQAFHERFGSLQTLGNWFDLLPGIVGILLAAPFVLELEQGTYRLAWTQSRSRERWLATRFGLLTAASVAVGVGTSLLFRWWHAPFVRFDGRLEPSFFDFQGVVPIGYVLFAVAVVVALGTLTRRTPVALAGGFVAFIAVRVSVETWLRPHYLPLRHARFLPTEGEPAAVRHAWRLTGSIVDAAGRRITSPDRLATDCRALPKGPALDACFRRHGIWNVVTYQPESRFWAFQWIELALYVGLAATLLGATAWWIRRRLA
jgi:hypothetical protein